MKDEPERSPESSHDNRRSHARFNAEIELSLSSDHNLFTGFTENISEGGLFIATHSEFPVGARFSVTFHVAGHDDPIDAQVEVRWIRPFHEGLGAPPGMGVRFVSIDERALDAIRSFLRHRDPIFYEE